MVAVVIPALDPPPSLSTLIRTLAADPGVARIIVVDDGSGESFRTVFQDLAATPRTTVLRHPRNLGKGAALKTAFDHIWQHCQDVTTVVTADADGQHLAADILRVAKAGIEAPDSLVLGVRDVGANAPLRSRFGNTFTRLFYRLLIGQQVQDTQTGLRAVPRAWLPTLTEISGSGYEYELNVLIHCRQASLSVVEVPVTTVYLDGNRASHFRPLLDSWRVFAVLLRFAGVSLASTIVDNVVFVAALSAGLGQPRALGLARLLSAGVNYPLVKHWVFRQSARELKTLGPYVALLAVNILAAQVAIRALQDLAGLPAPASKILWEVLCFLPNYVLQRDFVFRSSRAGQRATDWTSYYASVPITARWTRRYTARRLVAALQTAAAGRGRVRSIAELGGAASCFVDRVCQALNPDTYVVVDSNRFGLAQLREWRPPAGSHTSLELIEDDVRSIGRRDPVDTAFSVGLIEHFDPAETRAVLAAHFALVREGGAVVVSYPTPTWLYLATRRTLELLRLWRFPDERPLRFDEIERAVAGQGTVIHRQVLWPLMLTQEMVVLVKR